MHRVSFFFVSPLFLVSHRDKISAGAHAAERRDARVQVRVDWKCPAFNHARVDAQCSNVNGCSQRERKWQHGGEFGRRTTRAPGPRHPNVHPDGGSLDER